MVARVPGAFEIPLGVKKMAKSGRYDAIICLGCVIRGATPHFEYIATEVTKGIAHLSLENEIPISFGVLITDTIEQAIERAGTKVGNKGFDAALSAIEMASLMTEIGKEENRGNLPSRFFINWISPSKRIRRRSLTGRPTFHRVKGPMSLRSGSY